MNTIEHKIIELCNKELLSFRELGRRLKVKTSTISDIAREMQKRKIVNIRKVGNVKILEVKK